jgi:hypothetical protein
MIEIKYTYKIESIDKEAKTMTISYTSDVYGSIVSVAHLPKIDEDFDTVVEAYSPVREWVNRDKPYMDIDLGSTGIHTILTEDWMEDTEDLMEDTEDLMEDTEDLMEDGEKNIA